MARIYQAAIARWASTLAVKDEINPAAPALPEFRFRE
jgi:hypothetical protein